LVQLGGRALQNFTVPQLLADAYPEFDWEPYRFFQVSQKQWNVILAGLSTIFTLLTLADEEKKRKFVKYIENSLGIENEQQWANVSKDSLQNIKIPYEWGYMHTLRIF
jgi:hypothetical protein